MHVHHTHAHTCTHVHTHRPIPEAAPSKPSEVGSETEHVYDAGSGPSEDADSSQETYSRRDTCREGLFLASDSPPWKAAFVF